jgi:hypothetical protein
MDLNGFINVIIYKYRQKTIDRIEHDLTMEKWENIRDLRMARL